MKSKMINRLCISVLLTAVLTTTQILNVSALADSSAYKWSNVSIGGGGYTTGIVIHPKEPGLMYARSDVGGIFRWDIEKKKWKPLMDWVSYDQKKLYGVDGIALDPNNTDVVYAAVGKNWNQSGDVIKSTDRGETWTFTNLNKKFHGNGQWRYTGELIAVDPANSDIIYVGTRESGLYKSSDGAESWQQVSGVPAGEVVPQSEMPLLQECEYPLGTRSVVFDPTSASNGASQVIYASVIGKGIYQTNNAGVTWTLISGSPTLAARMEVSSDGVLYVTTLGQGVKKYYNGSWTDITPPNADSRFCGLSVDTNNPDNIIVSRWANTGECTELPIYRSKDKGVSWEMVSTTTEKNCKLAPPWFPSWFFLASTSQVIFDPHNQGQVFASDWYSVWKAPDIWTESAKDTEWYAMASGLENTCTFSLSAPNAGANLISAGADYGSLRHDDLNSFPEGEMVKTMGNVNSVDFCEADPNYIALTGSKFHDESGVFAVSSDNGKTFSTITSPDNARNGRVAYSATDINHIVWVPQSGAPIVTNDRGETWSATTGAPADTVTDFWLTNQPLAADRVNGNTFYLLRAIDGETNEFYRSTDGGMTWKMVNNTQLGEAVPWFWPQVKTAPGMEGEVWISQSTNGLYRSSDGGNTFTKVSQVQTARLVAFGKNPPGKSHPAVFVQGMVNGIDDGVFRSDDMGKTWIRINDETSKMGNVPNSMEGDRQVFGRVYIGTNGSGVYCGEAVQNSVYYDDFLTDNILSCADGGAAVENGVLGLPEGASVSGLRLPKNSSVEFDIKAAADGIGSLYTDTRKNSDGNYRITYSGMGFGIDRINGGSEVELAYATGPDKYELSTEKNMHIKYVTFEDRIGIYFNGKLIKTVIDDVLNKNGIYELSFVNEDLGDSLNHEVYIDNLKIKKVMSAECEELYEKQFHFDDFSGTEKPWYANDVCQVTDGALKISHGSKFKAYTIPKNAFIECDLSFKTEGEVTETDSKNVYTLEWNLRKTYDSQYYHLVNVCYNPYWKTINIQVTKVENGTKNWVGEITVQSESECQLRLCCDGNDMSVQLDGEVIYSWVDDIDYPEGAECTITERTWSNLSVTAYALMDNYKIAEDTGIENVDVFTDEITFNKNDGGVITGSERLFDGIYTLRTSLNNLTGGSKETAVGVGVYQDDRLVGISTSPVGVESGAYNQTVEIPFTLDYARLNPELPTVLKGFMLEDLNSFKPVIANTSVGDLSVIESDSSTICSYSFDDGVLPDCFDSTKFSVEDGMLNAKGGGSTFTFSDMPKDCSVEFKIKPHKNMYIPKFNVSLGNGSFTYYDNYRQKSTWSDKISVYNSITWGDSIEDIWANGTFFPDEENGHTVKFVSDGDAHSLYIDNVKKGTVLCTGVKNNYNVSFNVGSDAVTGVYLDDFVIKYLD